MDDQAGNWDADRMRKLVEGTQERDEANSLVAHASDCIECRNAIEALAAEERWWSSMQDCVGGEPDTDDDDASISGNESLGS
jgi:hypothetical protein